eukprot:538902-Prorocentrum_minimum.AAC.1
MYLPSYKRECLQLIGRRLVDLVDQSEAAVEKRKKDPHATSSARGGAGEQSLGNETCAMLSGGRRVGRCVLAQTTMVRAHPHLVQRGKGSMKQVRVFLSHDPNSTTNQ